MKKTELRPDKVFKKGDLVIMAKRIKSYAIFPPYLVSLKANWSITPIWAEIHEYSDHPLAEELRGISITETIYGFRGSLFVLNSFNLYGNSALIEPLVDPRWTTTEKVVNILFKWKILQDKVMPFLKKLMRECPPRKKGKNYKF